LDRVLLLLLLLAVLRLRHLLFRKLLRGLSWCGLLLLLRDV